MKELFPLNDRDLGGFPVKNGITKSHAFARSACPEYLHEGIIKQYINNNFNYVLDLRRYEETNVKPSFYSDIKDLKYHNIPLLKAKYDIKSEQPKRGEEYYNKMILWKDNFYSVFNFLANVREGVIYHCAGGKSRTGIVTALLLLLAGVDDEYIISDYCRSYKELYDMEVYNEKKELATVDMSNFLNLMKRNFLYIEDFFCYIGLTESEVDKLKNKIT